MKRSVVAVLHIGFWLCYALLAMVILAAVFGNDENPDESRMENVFMIILCFALIPSAISFYSFYLLIFPKYLKQHKITASVVYGGLISLGAGIVGFLLLGAYTSDANCSVDPVSTAVGVILFISFVALVSGIIALVIQGFITWLDELKLKEVLQEKNHEMEMALVKSQLDPHFLFNTINNIDVLILKDAANASNYLNKLSDIMRFMLYETKTDSIALSKEIAYIEKYIELQKIRTANASYVHFSVTGEPDNLLIAPMLFIPFIENAFKHTNNKKVADAITIRLHLHPDSIQFECENKFNPDLKKSKENTGLGNELIEKRLHLLYPKRHRLVVSNHNDLYCVQLTIYHG